MNISPAPVQTPLAAPVANERRLPLDEAELSPRDNLIPPPEDTEPNARPDRRSVTDRQPSEDQAPISADSQSTNDGPVDNEVSPEEQQQVAELAARDREVRAHEAAHANVGGQFAGAPSFTLERGPDGRSYAVAGEVPIDVSPVANNPQATIAKAQIVRRAALAPAQPSSQDRSIAAQASALELQARRELVADSNNNDSNNVRESASVIESDSDASADNANQFELVERLSRQESEGPGQSAIDILV